MRRAGGPAAIAGDDYQASVTALLMLDLLAGRIDDLRSQPPPLADFGESELIRVAADDVVVSTFGRRVYHQIKLRAPGSGQWTPRRLAAEGVLAQFVVQLAADPAGQCVLVSDIPSRLLGELAERARSAVSEREFVTNLGSDDRETIKQVSEEIGDLTPFQFLRRCSLWQISVPGAGEDLRERSARFLCGSSPSAEALKGLARKTTGRVLDRDSLRQLLEDNGLFLRPTLGTPKLLVALREASSWLRMAPRSICGVHIERHAVAQAVDFVAAGEPNKSRVAVFLDQAGSGKTTAMASLLDRLEQEGYAVLGIRLDSIRFSSAAELAAVLCLPATVPEVLSVLAADGHRPALLVDQLDALSSAAGRDSGAMLVVLDLIARVANGLGIPVVLACRSFDWRFDYRLRDVRHANPVELLLPDLLDEEIDPVLDALGVQRRALHPLALAALRRPLHLRLFEEILHLRRQKDPAWGPSATRAWTLQSLYTDLLELKLSKATAEGISAQECDGTLAALATEMQRREELSLPLRLFQDSMLHLHWLCSEGLLSQHASSVAFFHQTLFDFVFARKFVAEGKSLVTHLLSTEQGFFHRPLVRQVLEHLRGTNALAFRREVAHLIDESRIRRHVRTLVLKWLGQLPDPVPVELSLIEPLLAVAGTRSEMLGYLARNSAWFDLLGTARLARWLAETSGTELNGIVWYVGTIAPARQAEVCALLEPFLGQDVEWNARIGYSLAAIQKGWGVQTADLLRRLVTDPGTPVENEGAWWWHALHSLAADNPLVAMPVIRAILDRSVLRLAAEPRPAAEGTFQDRSVLPTDYSFREALKSASDKQPGAFLEAVLPLAITLMESTSDGADARGLLVSWRLWEFEHRHLQTSETALLRCIRQAYVAVARQDPARFCKLAVPVVESSIRMLRKIAAESFTQHPAELARDAALFLTSDSRNMTLGRPIVELIKACRGSWTDRQHAHVETSVLLLRDRDVQDVQDLRRAGLGQLELLEALDLGRLSLDGRVRLDLLQRKFADRPRSLPERELEGFVGSPIPPEAVARMSNRAWLQAMRRYDTEWDRRGRLRPAHLSGGCHQLASVLKEQAKQDPQRFAAFALASLDCSFHPSYLTAVIGGLSEAQAPIDSFEQVALKLAPALGWGEARVVCWAIKSYAKAGVDVGTGLRGLLERWLLETEWGKDDGEPAAGSLRGYLSGINTDRGAALDALAAVILGGAERDVSGFLALVERLLPEAGVGVRAVAIEHLGTIRPPSAASAWKLFRQLVGSSVELLCGRGALAFLWRAICAGQPEASWAIDAMLEDGSHETVREHGGVLASLARHYLPDGPALAERSLCGDPACRKGAARFLAANVASPLLGSACRAGVIRVFEDPDETVREEGCGFFHSMGAEDVRELGDFLRDWARSSAVVDGAEDAARMLASYPCADPLLTLDLAEAIIVAVGSSATDIRLKQATIPYHLVPALINVYREALDPELRRRTMDLLENAEDLGWREVGEAYEPADRC